jgi:23S rRNA pseudouridine1911/1915/1917 synthase
MTFFHPRWPVFYEDNHLLVLYKPAGLIMQRGPSAKPNLVDLAKAWLKDRYAKPGQVFVGMVHRLDGPVAGVLTLARTSKAAGPAQRPISPGRHRKTYLAVVQGQPGAAAGRLVHHLARQGRYSRPAAADTPSSQTAALSYRLLERRPGQSLLAVRLETGRRHQIRAQLAAIGCPIWGDNPLRGRSVPALRVHRLAGAQSGLRPSHPTNPHAL